MLCVQAATEPAPSLSGQSVSVIIKQYLPGKGGWKIMPEDQNIDLRTNHEVVEQVLARLRCSLVMLGHAALNLCSLVQGPAVLRGGHPGQDDLGHSVRGDIFTVINISRVINIYIYCMYFFYSFQSKHISLR